MIPESRQEVHVSVDCAELLNRFQAEAEER